MRLCENNTNPTKSTQFILKSVDLCFEMCYTEPRKTAVACRTKGIYHMNQRTERRRQILLIALASLAYFVNYLTRYNFNAALEGMGATLGVGKTMLGLVLTGGSIAYGVGQVFSGFAGDRVSPRLFVFVGLLGTSLCNLAVPHLSVVPLLMVAWCCNGVFQSMIWPALIRIMAENLSEQAYRKGALAVSYACSLSTVTVYLLLVPLCLKYFTWQTAFYIPAAIGIVSALLWLFLVPHTCRKDVPPLTEKTPAAPAPVPVCHPHPLRVMWQAGIPVILLCVACQGLLRDGVSTWMPSLIGDVYHMEAAASVMTVSILPLFSMVSITLTGKLYDRIGDEQLTCAILWTLGGACAMLLFLFFPANTVVAVLLLALLTGCIHGINHLLTGRVPRRFSSFGCVSSVTGILNASTYIGSALSGYGFALLSEHFGWRVTVLAWGMAAIIGLVLTLISLRRYRRFLGKASK